MYQIPNLLSEQFISIAMVYQHKHANTVHFQGQPLFRGNYADFALKTLFLRIKISPFDKVTRILSLPGGSTDFQYKNKYVN